MKDEDNRREQEGLKRAFAGISFGASRVLKESVAVARYCWNVQMRILKRIGLMPYFIKHMWLFGLVAFLLLVFALPLGIAFVVTFLSAAQHDASSENEYIVPLGRAEEN